MPDDALLTTEAASTARSLPRLRPRYGIVDPAEMVRARAGAYEDQNLG